MVKPEPTPPASSPPAEAAAVPLDSTTRDIPIHPDLVEIKFQMDYQTELKQLEEQYKSREAALHAQEQIAKEVKEKIETAKRKREEVQKSMDKKVKERDTEMKVVSKFQETKASDIPS
ncbi:hypothetical protein HAV15_005805 [Penicillium sp. str. |nr:hypothetical protein HAV15_005805 [Penicillium sp. str. \